MKKALLYIALTAAVAILRAQTDNKQIPDTKNDINVMVERQPEYPGGTEKMYRSSTTTD